MHLQYQILLILEVVPEYSSSSRFKNITLNLGKALIHYK